MTKRLVLALKAAKKPVPLYLAGLDAQLNSKSHTVTFAMHCYWDGEAKLGSIDGVLSTRAGWYARKEVVELRFNPDKVSLKKLIQEAKKFQCASNVYVMSAADLKIAQAEVGALAELRKGAVRDAKASDQKFALNRSPLRYLPLNSWQACKVNAALRLGTDSSKWLSPRQEKLAKKVKAALKKDPEALKGLKPPRELAKLGDYQQRLEAKLASTKS